MLFAAIAIYACGCSKEEEGQQAATYESKWNLSAVYMDPGDGSGNFTPVTSSKYFEFYADGTLKSNGEICSMDADTQQATVGTFSATNKTLVSANCAVSTWNITYEMRGDTLDVYYPCIEPCIARYLAD